MFFQKILKVYLLSWILEKLSGYILEHHPPTQNDSYYFNNLDKALDLYSHYDKNLLVGDFKIEVSDVLSPFLYQHNLKNLVKDKTCFKNANNPSTTDLFWPIILQFSKTQQQWLVFLIAIN